MEKRERLIGWMQLCGLLLTAMAAGGMGGSSYERWRQTASRPPVIVGDYSDEISLIRFDSIENGRIKGSLEGKEARVVVEGAAEVYSLFPGEFEFSLTEILPNLDAIPAPAGMRFVASKNGKYCYPLDSPRAALISAKNRIFFADEAAARRAGFARGKE
jgi:hypothetical protein